MIKRVFLLCIIVFALATALSMRLEAMSDGYTTLGFPVPFLQYTSGKCVACAHYFKWYALTFDLLISLIAACGGLKAWKIVLDRSE